MPNAHLPVTNYPQYGIDFDSATMDRIAAMAERLLVETGLDVPCDPFVERIRGKKGFVPMTFGWRTPAFKRWKRSMRPQRKNC